MSICLQRRRAPRSYLRAMIGANSDAGIEIPPRTPGDSAGTPPSTTTPTLAGTVLHQALAYPEWPCFRWPCSGGWVGESHLQVLVMTGEPMIYNDNVGDISYRRSSQTQVAFFSQRSTFELVRIFSLSPLTTSTTFLIDSTLEWSFLNQNQLLIWSRIIVTMLQGNSQEISQTTGIKSYQLGSTVDGWRFYQLFELESMVDSNVSE